MKITILNGSESGSALDTYLDHLRQDLAHRENEVCNLIIRDLQLRSCTGCFGCWVKTPGYCILQDDSEMMDRFIIQADFVLWAAPLKMGFPVAAFKTAIDKHLPLISPYIEISEGEIHHQKRYKRYPRLGMLVEQDESTDGDDLNIVKNIFARTALNFKSKLEFFHTSDAPIEKISSMILHLKARKHLYATQLPELSHATIQPPQSLTVFNGSPRGLAGNTPVMLSEFMKGFAKPTQMVNINKRKRTNEFVELFAEAECVWLGFPLYTDAMPGVVKHFMDAMEVLCERPQNAPIGFLVQSGFAEGVHSRYVEQYLHKFAQRMHSPYLGTIIHGGGEGTRLMPPKANRKLFENLQSLGKDLSEHGTLNSETLCELAKPERIPTWMLPLIRVMLKMPIAGSYFDQQLKQNGAYEKRKAQPLI